MQEYQLMGGDWSQNSKCPQCIKVLWTPVFFHFASLRNPYDPLRHMLLQAFFSKIQRRYTPSPTAPQTNVLLAFL